MRIPRRSPWRQYFTPERLEKTNRIGDRVSCGHCKPKCPCGLDTRQVLKYMLKNYWEFYEAHKSEL